MLTIAAVPKPFVGEYEVLQRNAIVSWTRLEPRPEVLLFGTDAGVAEAAAELGVTHVPEVEKTAHGTPFLSDVLLRAQARAEHELVCYMNADIVMLPGFMEAIHAVRSRYERFLAVGQRWELDVRTLLPFDTDWQHGLRERVRRSGCLAGFTAIDYFTFPRGFYAELPPFIAGRAGFDWWLIHDALRRRAPVVDMTRSITAVHQIHSENPFRSTSAFREEVEHNYALYQVPWTNLYDATHVLVDGKLRKTRWRSPAKRLWAWHWRRGRPLTRMAGTLRRALRRLRRGS